MNERLNSQSNLENIKPQLRDVQRKISAEASAAVVLGTLTLPLLLLAMAVPNPDAGNAVSAAGLTAAWSLVMGLSAFASGLGSRKFAIRTADRLKERGQIIQAAKEKGLKVSGIIFKKVK